MLFTGHFFSISSFQSQCLVNVCGDMAQVIYGLELQPLTGGGTPGSLESSKGGGSTTGSGGVSPALLEHKKPSPRSSPNVAVKLGTVGLAPPNT